MQCAGESGYSELIQNRLKWHTETVKYVCMCLNGYTLFRENSVNFVTIQIEVFHTKGTKGTESLPQAVMACHGANSLACYDRPVNAQRRGREWTFPSAPLGVYGTVVAGQTTEQIALPE